MCSSAHCVHVLPIQLVLSVSNALSSVYVFYFQILNWTPVKVEIE